MAFNPRSNVLASGSYDESVRLWDGRSGRCLRMLPCHSEPVTSVHFSPDGTVLATSSYDGLVRLWDVSTGQCLKTLQETDGMPPVTHCRYSPNGVYLLSSSLDDRLRLWDYVESRKVKTYTGHVNGRYCIASAFLAPAPALVAATHGSSSGSSGSSSGSSGAASAPSSAAAKPAYRQLIASGSEDGVVYIWDVQTRRIVSQCKGHAGAVLAVDAHPTELRLVSGGTNIHLAPPAAEGEAPPQQEAVHDYSIRMWALEEGGLQQHSSSMDDDDL